MVSPAPDAIEILGFVSVNGVPAVIASISNVLKPEAVAETLAPAALALMAFAKPETKSNSLESKAVAVIFKIQF